MKVREMEIQIDKLGLEKLNVRLGKGGRVHGAPDKPCGVGRADANPKLLLNDT